MKRYSDQECIDALLAAAAECGNPLLIAGYEGWAKERDGVPGTGTISRRFGSWPAALASAGLESARPPVGMWRRSPGLASSWGPRRTWTAEECVEAVARAERALGRPPGAWSYEQWRKINVVNVPSYRTIVKRCGTWPP